MVSEMDDNFDAKAMLNELELSMKFANGPLSADELVKFASAFETTDDAFTWAISAASALMSMGLSHEKFTKEAIVVGAQMLCARIPDSLLGVATANLAKHAADLAQENGNN
jgi:hypothetical protein